MFDINVVRIQFYKKNTGNIIGYEYKQKLFGSFSFHKKNRLLYYFIEKIQWNKKENTLLILCCINTYNNNE